MAKQFSDFDKLLEDEPRPVKVAFFGDPKCGKSYGAMTLAIACLEHYKLPGHIALLDTFERTGADWSSEVYEKTGRKLAKFCTDDPAIAEKFLATCEEDERISVVVVDSVTDLLKKPRERWTSKHGRAPQGTEYGLIDLPFHQFVDQTRRMNKPLICTTRVDDDKIAIGSSEITVGKRPKASDFGWVPRLLVHCEPRKTKGGGREVWYSVADTDPKAGPPQSYGPNPGAEIWPAHLERFKVAA